MSNSFTRTLPTWCYGVLAQGAWIMAFGATSRSLVVSFLLYPFIRDQRHIIAAFPAKWRDATTTFDRFFYAFVLLTAIGAIVWWRDIAPNVL